VLDKEKHTAHRWPWFLPDGKQFIFLATSHTGGRPEYDGIYLGSVDSTQTHMVVASDSGAIRVRPFALSCEPGTGGATIRSDSGQVVGITGASD
jgi:hypothetical protein